MSESHEDLHDFFFLDLHEKEITVLEGLSKEEMREWVHDHFEGVRRPKDAIPPMVLNHKTMQQLIVMLLRAYATYVGADPDTVFDPEGLNIVPGNQTIN